MFTARSKYHLNAALLISMVFYFMAIWLAATTNQANGIVIFFWAIGAFSSYVSAVQVYEEHKEIA